MKHFLATNLRPLDPRFTFQRGMDSIHWVIAAYLPQWALGARDTLHRNYTWCAPPEPGAQASRTRAAHGLPSRYAPVPSLVTTTSPSPDTSNGVDVFVLVTCVTAALAFCPPRLAPKLQIYATHLVPVCVVPQASAAGLPLPIDNIQESRLVEQAPAYLSLPDQPPPHALEHGRQEPDSPSQLAQLRALPLGPEQADFDYEDLAWHSFVGVGGFGAVYKAVVRRTGQEVAVKCVRHWSEKGYEYILNEVVLTEMLGRSPWYPEFYGAFSTRDKVFVAMELHSGRSLHDYIGSQGGRLHPHVARFYAAELLIAISHAHALGIMHRDIKPENVLLDKAGHLVVIDMGLAVRFGTGDDAWTRGTCGTPGFMAPEVVLGQLYDTRADCFAWGVTLYCMLVGTFPIRLSRDGAGQPITANKPCYYLISNDAFTGYWERDLLTQVLAHDIRDRPTLSQIKKHPYWIGLDWEKIEQRPGIPPVARGPGCPRLGYRLQSQRQTVT
ncbi:kinase-like domain-containing protein [Infundibulicybe gibba]|nr:kinase-like domain-containing protein [Infundibulicybe gibba]